MVAYTKPLLYWHWPRSLWSGVRCLSVCLCRHMLKLSETITDMVAYTRVNDSLYLRILHSTEPELAEARSILEKVECRRLYRFVGQTNPKPGREDVTVTAPCWPAVAFHLHFQYLLTVLSLIFCYLAELYPHSYDAANLILAFVSMSCISSCLQCFDAVGWVAGRHPACKKLRVVGYWRGYLSGARCRLAYGPADATATYCLLLQ